MSSIAKQTSKATALDLIERIDLLAERNRVIHEQECFNLNPATNVMNPKAEALLASGIGNRPSLGYPGDKYEMGLEAIEEIEVIAAELCAEVFEAKYAEIRVPSGALANLYGFMATCKPGDTIIVPPVSISGHVTHHMVGCAGWFGVEANRCSCSLLMAYTVDLDQLRDLALREQPKTYYNRRKPQICLNIRSRRLGRLLMRLTPKLCSMQLINAV